MKSLLKDYMDNRISRRRFVSGLASLGISSTMARSMAALMAPGTAMAQAGAAENAQWIRQARGTGAELLVEQLKASGIEYVFCNPAAGQAAIFDALVDEPKIQIVKALHEGTLGAMADGYAKATLKTSFVLMASPGVPNCMTQMFNSFKDQIPIVVAADAVSPAAAGRDGFEDVDHLEDLPTPVTKWHWTAESAAKIPETTRRAFQFAGTAPHAPVFMGLTGLTDEAQVPIMDQSKFTVPMKLRPDPALVEQTARMLLEAKNPLLFVGDEIVWCGAQKEVIELAELLGLPVARANWISGWSKPFPTTHPLYLGGFLSTAQRYPHNIDLMLNLGSRMPGNPPSAAVASSTKFLHVRLDPVNLARIYPAEVAMIADLKIAISELIAAVRSMATAERLKQISEPRLQQTRQYTTKMKEYRQSIAKRLGNKSGGVHTAYLGLELENTLDRNTCFVAETDSGRVVEHVLDFSDGNKEFFSNGGRALGWGMGAAFGVKLAHPDRPVVAVVGDGAFNFTGPQPLWSYARYKAGITVIVLNNRCYDNERNRMFGRNGRQAQTGKDMICYNGNPDIDYVKVAAGYGVEGEVVKEPSQLRAALQRAKSAMAQNSPYILDIQSTRMGRGAQSPWHPEFTLAGLRGRA
jgi:thiamine pyrophosphate-dependent acetolactate synthase large subunit-like protein